MVIIDQITEQVRQSWLERGHELPDSDPGAAPCFDSNSITPGTTQQHSLLLPYKAIALDSTPPPSLGTAFMSRVSTHLEYYIHARLENDPQWKVI